MPIFDRGQTSFYDFVTYFERELPQRWGPCQDALAYCRSLPDDWDHPGVANAPAEYAFVAIDQFSSEIGPWFREVILKRLEREPFWAARAWVSLDLAPAEYERMLAAASDRYPWLRSRAESGESAPGQAHFGKSYREYVAMHPDTLAKR